MGIRGAYGSTNLLPWQEKKQALLGKTEPDKGDYLEFNEALLQASVQQLKDDYSKRPKKEQINLQRMINKMVEDFYKAQVDVLKHYHQHITKQANEAKKDNEVLKDLVSEASKNKSDLENNVRRNREQIQKNEKEISENDVIIKSPQDKPMPPQPIGTGGPPPPPPPPPQSGPGGPPIPPPPPLGKKLGIPQTGQEGLKKVTPPLPQVSSAPIFAPEQALRVKLKKSSEHKITKKEGDLTPFEKLQKELAGKSKKVKESSDRIRGTVQIKSPTGEALDKEGIEKIAVLFDKLMSDPEAVKRLIEGNVEPWLKKTFEAIPGFEQETLDLAKELHQANQRKSQEVAQPEEIVPEEPIQKTEVSVSVLPSTAIEQQIKKLNSEIDAKEKEIVRERKMLEDNIQLIFTYGSQASDEGKQKQQEQLDIIEKQKAEIAEQEIKLKEQREKIDLQKKTEDEAKKLSEPVLSTSSSVDSVLEEKVSSESIGETIPQDLNPPLPQQTSGPPPPPPLPPPLQQTSGPPPPPPPPQTQKKVVKDTKDEKSKKIEQKEVDKPVIRTADAIAGSDVFKKRKEEQDRRDKEREAEIQRARQEKLLKEQQEMEQRKVENQQRIDKLLGKKGTDQEEQKEVKDKGKKEVKVENVGPPVTVPPVVVAPVVVPQVGPPQVGPSQVELSQALCDLIRNPSVSSSQKLLGVKNLLDQGAKLDYLESYSGASPLHLACGLGSGDRITGNVELVKLLIEKGADPNIKDQFERTPLHFAGTNNYGEVYNYLVSKGADETIRWKGKTPKELLEDHAKKEVDIKVELEATTKEILPVVERLRKIEDTLNQSMQEKSQFNTNREWIKNLGEADLVKIADFSQKLQKAIGEIKIFRGQHRLDGETVYADSIRVLKDNSNLLNHILLENPQLRKLYEENIELLEKVDKAFTTHLEQQVKDKAVVGHDIPQPQPQQGPKQQIPVVDTKALEQDKKDANLLALSRQTKSVNWYEVDQSTLIYTDPMSKEEAEKLLKELNPELKAELHKSSSSAGKYKVKIKYKNIEEALAQGKPLSKTQGPYQYLGTEGETRRAGHVLGISGGMQVKVQDPHDSDVLKTVAYQTEANFDRISGQYVQEKLSQYKPRSHQEEWQKIGKMFDQTAQNTNILGAHNAQRIAQNQLDRINSGEPVHISSGWSGHSIGITFYKGYMIVSNRGEGGEWNKGTIIYKLKQNPTADDLIKLQKTIYEGDVSRRAANKIMSMLQGERVAEFPQKPQKYGTCSYVNKIAATEGLLCLLSLEKEGKLNDESIKAYASDKQKRGAYKEFTKANRDAEIERVIGLIKQAEMNNNKEQLGIMVNIAFGIAEKYQGSDPDPEKNRIQIQRASELLKAIEGHTEVLTTANKKQYPSVKKYFQISEFKPEHLAALTSQTNGKVWTSNGVNHVHTDPMTITEAQKLLDSLNPKLGAIIHESQSNKGFYRVYIANEVLHSLVEDQPKKDAASQVPENTDTPQAPDDSRVRGIYRQRKDNLYEYIALQRDTLKMEPLLNAKVDPSTGAPIERDKLMTKIHEAKQKQLELLEKEKKYLKDLLDAGQTHDIESGRDLQTELTYIENELKSIAEQQAQSPVNKSSTQAPQNEIPEQSQLPPSSSTVLNNPPPQQNPQPEPVVEQQNPSQATSNPLNNPVIDSRTVFEGLPRRENIPDDQLFSIERRAEDVFFKAIQTKDELYRWIKENQPLNTEEKSKELEQKFQEVFALLDEVDNLHAKIRLINAAPVEGNDSHTNHLFQIQRDARDYQTRAGALRMSLNQEKEELKKQKEVASQIKPQPVPVVDALTNPTSDDDDEFDLPPTHDWGERTLTTPEALRELRMGRWPQMIDPKQWGTTKDNWYGESIVSDYVNHNLRKIENVMLPKLDALQERDLAAQCTLHISSIDALRNEIKKKLNEAKQKDGDAIIPLLINQNGHYVTYMVHKQGNEVFVRAMDGLLPSSQSEKGPIHQLVREVFSNAKFDRSTTPIQHDISSCGPIMLLVTELSIKNPQASAEQVVQLAQSYLKELSPVSNNAQPSDKLKAFNEAMLLVRKQQAFSLLTPDEQEKIRKGEKVEKMEMITREDVERFEKAFNKCVRSFENVDIKPDVNPIVPSDYEKPSDKSKAELLTMLKELGIQATHEWDHIKIENLKERIGDANYDNFLKLLKSINNSNEFPPYVVEGNNLKFYDSDIQALMTNKEAREKLSSLLPAVNMEKSPTVVHGLHKPPPAPVVVDPLANFKEVAQKMAVLSNEKKTEFGIKSIDTSKMNGPNPSVSMTMICGDESIGKTKQATITPAGPGGGVVYSLELSLNPAENNKMITNLINSYLETVKPGSTVSVPNVPNKDEIEKALDSALKTKYGDTVKKENGVYTIPEKPTQQPILQVVSSHKPP